MRSNFCDEMSEWPFRTFYISTGLAQDLGWEGIRAMRNLEHGTNLGSQINNPQVQESVFSYLYQSRHNPAVECDFVRLREATARKTPWPKRPRQLAKEIFVDE